MARAPHAVRALLSIGILVAVGTQCGVDETLLPLDRWDPDDGGFGATGGSASGGGEGGSSAGRGGGGGGGQAGSGGLAGAAGASGAAGEGGSGSDCGFSNDSPCEPEVNLKVAFLGDQSLSSDAGAVLRLISRERADFVIHLGDFDYAYDPAAWEEQINTALGADFPYFAAVGNHDVGMWPDYQKLLLARLARIDGAECWGDYGVNAACRYKGLFFVLSGVGTFGEKHEEFLSAALSDSKYPWKICAWHKNQHDMQTGGKLDEVGWDAYQICQDHGALIATAHEHAYSRTFTLNNLGSSAAQHGVFGGAELMTLTPGRTFVFVSGLGGHSIRPFLHEKRVAPWWATVYTSDVYVRNGEPIWNYVPAAGALFLEFNIGGDPLRGRGYFKNIRHELVDTFKMVAGTGE